MGKSLASQKGKKCKTKTKSYVICYLRALGFFGNYEKKKENRENAHTIDRWWSCEIRCAQLLGTPQNQSEVEIAWEAMVDVNYY